MLSPMTYTVHAPALSLPEAAMLPAMEAENLPRNLVLPDRRTYFPMPPAQPEIQIAQRPKGSMAGRALLHYVENAPARRPKREAPLIT